MASRPGTACPRITNKKEGKGSPDPLPQNSQKKEGKPSTDGLPQNYPQERGGIDMRPMSVPPLLKVKIKQLLNKFSSESSQISRDFFKAAYFGRKPYGG